MQITNYIFKNPLKHKIMKTLKLCNDHACNMRAFCERYQKFIKNVDSENVENFQGCNIKGLCKYFLNIDIKN